MDKNNIKSVKNIYRKIKEYYREDAPSTLIGAY